MFNPPPTFDDSRNLSQWICYTAEHSANHPLFAYANSGSQVHTITWSEVGAAVERAAVAVDSLFDLVSTRTDQREKTPAVVGILANLDSITYHVLYLGILRAGGTVFFISLRNSPAAVSHLLKQCGTHRLLVSADEPVQKLARAAVDLASKEDHQVTVCTAPTFQTLFEDNNIQFLERAGLDTDMDAPAVILHSSGSTSFPKAIALSQRIVLQWATGPGFAGIDETKQRLSVHALPVYHGMGFCVTFWAVRTGLTLGVFPPKTPPIIPSPATVLESAIASQSTFIFCVPLFVEMWSRDQSAIAQLKSLNGILYGGGPCNPVIGNQLEQLGVQLFSFYGATEIGPFTLVGPREADDHGWDWQKVHPRTDGRFIPQDDPDTYELVYVECPTHTPLVSNSTIDGKRAYATSDIVIKHPNDPLKFKIQGRKDEQIMLSSGEKTNPGPIERIICGSSLVHAAVMFGRGRDQNGIIIQPAQGHEFDPADTAKLSRFRNDIWASVEEANEFAPSHSRLYKEMIVVTYPWRPLEMTAKHSPRRGAALEAYKDEIEAAYSAVEASTQTSVVPPSTWEYTEVLAYVRKVVHNVLDKHVGDEADFFEQGGDSLRATYIRNSLVHAIRQAHKGTVRHISQNFVYVNPTIARLVGRLLAIVNVIPETNDDAASLKLQEMEDAISEFSTHFPQPRANDSQVVCSYETILLTGTTGGLGSQLLAHLSTSPHVSRVYALNRRSKKDPRSLRERQAEALIERGLDAGLLDSPKVFLVEGDTSVEDLDIDSELYQEIRDNITLIIHNAWHVNFNLEFGAFKGSIRGVRTLIDLALNSPRRNPPRYIFISTVGVFRQWDPEQGRPMEARISDLKIALGHGYAESKLVGERILENAAKSTSLRPIIVRIGQLTGTPSGAWNLKDWLPAIVRSGQVLGVLPRRSDCVSWISLETSAQAIFDFRHSDSQYLHLAHPKPIPWSTVFDVFSSRLQAPLVSWSEWLAKLEQSDGKSGRNPAIYLLDFFRGCAPMATPNREAPGIPLLHLQQALKYSPSLADPSLPQISREDAEQWLRYWKSAGFLSNEVEDK